MVEKYFKTEWAHCDCEWGLSCQIWTKSKMKCEIPGYLRLDFDLKYELKDIDIEEILM